MIETNKKLYCSFQKNIVCNWKNNIIEYKESLLLISEIESTITFFFRGEAEASESCCSFSIFKSEMVIAVILEKEKDNILEYGLYKMIITD